MPCCMLLNEMAVVEQELTNVLRAHLSWSVSAQSCTMKRQHLGQDV